MHTFVGGERVGEALRHMDSDVGGPTWLRELSRHGYVYTCERCGEEHVRGEHNLCTCDACAAAAALREMFARQEEQATYSFRNKVMSKEQAMREEEAKIEREATNAYVDNYSTKEHTETRQTAYKRQLRNLYLLARKTPQERLPALLKALRENEARYKALAKSALEREDVEPHDQAILLASAYSTAADMVWARTRQARDVKPRRKHKDQPQYARTLDVATYHEGDCSCGYGYWG